MTAGNDNSTSTFEELLSELEAITARMASPEIGLEEAADLYERASQLHATASERLANIAERIDQLTAPAGQADGATDQDDDGQA